jgi:hypothetical protein
VSSTPDTSRKTTALLSEVLRRFWWPVYHEVRRRGHGPAESRHLTSVILSRAADSQSFFRTDDFGGRLRHVVRNEFLAVVNNPDRTLLPLAPPVVTASETEPREGYDPGLVGDPFNRCWAIAVLELALESLREDYRKQGKVESMKRLEPYLGRRVPDDLEMDIEDSVSDSEVDNLRDRFRDLVRQHVAETVTTPLALEAELAELFGAP